MSGKIDEKTVVPLGWVLSGMSVICVGVIAGTAWVFSVNYRLGRIEQKLGIPAQAEAKSSIIDQAKASE